MGRREDVEEVNDMGASMLMDESGRNDISDRLLAQVTRIRPAPRNRTKNALPDPVKIPSNGVPGSEVVARLVQSYEEHGFARFKLEGSPDRAAPALSKLSLALGLQPPVVPALYRGADTSHLYDEYGFNTISTKASASTVSGHPTFESSAEVELHTDGTLQPIGEIHTSLLYCISPALRGGETTLFHAVEAFVELAREAPTLAAALLHPQALSRRATVNGSTAVAVGPVFALVGEHVYTRYSRTPRDEFAFDRVERLREACLALAERAHPSTPFYAQLGLSAGEGIFLANARLSHGRTAIHDLDSPRRLLRGLFRERPRASASPTASPVEGSFSE